MSVKTSIQTNAQPKISSLLVIPIDKKTNFISKTVFILNEIGLGSHTHVVRETTQCNTHFSSILENLFLD